MQIQPIRAQVLQVIDQSGISKADKPFSKHLIIVKPDNTTETLAVGWFNPPFQAEVKATYDFFVDLKSREWNGKFFTECAVLRAEVVEIPAPETLDYNLPFGQPEAVQAEISFAQVAREKQEAMNAANVAATDDLPF